MRTGNPFNPSADSQWSSVGNQDCLQYHLWGWGEHLLCLQNKGQGQRPGSPTAQIQVGIKSAPRQISTVAERGWREPRQAPLLAKSSCPQGINGGLYHCSRKSKPPKTLVSIQHPHEDWRGPKMQTVWPFRWDHWPSGHWLSWTVHNHKKAAAHIHWTICKEFSIEVKEWWYEYEPTTATEKDSVTILWNMTLQTDRTIAANTPDIVLENKKDKSYLLIDMTIPLDTNISVKL